MSYFYNHEKQENIFKLILSNDYSDPCVFLQVLDNVAEYHGTEHQNDAQEALCANMAERIKGIQMTIPSKELYFPSQDFFDATAKLRDVEVLECPLAVKVVRIGSARTHEYVWEAPEGTISLRVNEHLTTEGVDYASRLVWSCEHDRYVSDFLVFDGFGELADLLDSFDNKSNA